MADDYVIIARIVIKDETGPGIAGAKKGLADVERQAVTVGNNMGRQLMQAFAGFGSMAGVATATRSIVNLHSEVQQAEAGMATLLSAHKGTDITTSLATARDLVRDLRDDAASGAGELNHYLQGMQTIIGPGLALGASEDMLRELNRNSLAAGFALKGEQGMSLASFDVAQAMTGQVGDKTTPIVMQALQAAGITADQFRALSPEKRIATLNEAFGEFADGVELMGQTWSAQMSTLQDGIKELIRSVTTPLFDRWNDGLKKANQWMEKNSDELYQQVDVWGARLLSVWDHLIDKAGTYAAIVGGVAVVQGLGGAGNLADMAGRARGGLGSTILGGGAGIGAMLGGIGPALRGLAAGASRLAGPFAVVGAAFVGVKNAMGEFPEKLTEISLSWTDLKGSIMQLGEEINGLLASNGLTSMGGLLLDFFDILVVGASGLVRLTSMLVRGFGLVAEAVPLMWDSFKAGFTGDRSGQQVALDKLAKLFVDADFEDIWTRHGATSQGQGIPWYSDMYLNEHGPWATPPPPSEASTKDTPKLPPLNIGPVKIEITAETMEDPARVAVTMETVLGRLSRNRTQSRRPGLPYPV